MQGQLPQNEGSTQDKEHGRSRPDQAYIFPAQRGALRLSGMGMSLVIGAAMLHSVLAEGYACGRKTVIYVLSPVPVIK